MIEMASVLLASGILMVLAYEFSTSQRREWGENSKSIF